MTWQSSDAGVGTVNGSGIVRGVHAGSATITASIDASHRAVATVTVREGSVAEIVAVTITPHTLTANVRDSLFLRATFTDANGLVVWNQTVRWTSLQPSIAAVSPWGGIMALSPGSAHIVAAAPNGKADTAVVTVR
ncbi:MAG: Ig-like domain-containing protein [Gemmatimonadota bacterium]|nr:Ig-like domain-containing protein [Gemmatimonadota bacterium]